MVVRVLALVLAVGVLAAGCSSDGTPEEGSQEQPATGGEPTDNTADGEVASEEPAELAAPGEPIRIGEISSYSGLDIFPEAATIARLVFKEYNDQGGLDGRPIHLVSVDDQNTLEGAASAARRLLQDEQVVGICCGGSIVDCPTNAEFYNENGVEELATTAACIEAPTVHPVNAGPFVPTLHMLDFFVSDLGAQNICFIGFNINLTPIFDELILPGWEEARGLEVTRVLIDPGGDMTPGVIQLANEGCEGVLTAFTELNYQSFFQVVNDQELLDEMAYGMLTSGYSLSLLDAMGDQLEGVYTNSEYEPYTGDPALHSEEVQGFLDLTAELGVLPTSFGEGGYVAAHIVIEVLESIEGEITFESFQEAVRNVSYESVVMGGTFTASGYMNNSQPNQNSQVLRVENGDFIPKTGWRVFNPEAPPVEP